MLISYNRDLYYNYTMETCINIEPTTFAIFVQFFCYFRPKFSLFSSKFVHLFFIPSTNFQNNRHQILLLQCPVVRAQKDLDLELTLQSGGQWKLKTRIMGFQSLRFVVWLVVAVLSASLDWCMTRPATCWGSFCIISWGMPSPTLIMPRGRQSLLWMWCMLSRGRANHSMDLTPDSSFCEFWINKRKMSLPPTSCLFIIIIISFLSYHIIHHITSYENLLIITLTLCYYYYDHDDDQILKFEKPPMKVQKVVLRLT